MPPKNYMVIESDKISSLEIEINQLIENGYICIGGPFFHNEKWKQAVQKDIIKDTLQNALCEFWNSGITLIQQYRDANDSRR